MSTVEVRALVRKEWYSINWQGDLGEDPDKAGDAESLNCDESSLPLELVYPPSVSGHLHHQW